MTLTSKDLFISVSIKCPGRGEHDGGVEVAEDPGHGVGGVLQGVGPAGQGVQGGQHVGAFLSNIASVVRDISQDKTVILCHLTRSSRLDQLDSDLSQVLDR